VGHTNAIRVWSGSPDEWPTIPTEEDVILDVQLSEHDSHFSLDQSFSPGLRCCRYQQSVCEVSALVSKDLTEHNSPLAYLNEIYMVHYNESMSHRSKRPITVFLRSKFVHKRGLVVGTAAQIIL
jgi:hypothetical protein